VSQHGKASVLCANPLPSPRYVNNRDGYAVVAIPKGARRRLRGRPSPSGLNGRYAIAERRPSARP
jgi:hypothetical protein